MDHYRLNPDTPWDLHIYIDPFSTTPTYVNMLRPIHWAHIEVTNDRGPVT